MAVITLPPFQLGNPNLNIITFSGSCPVIKDFSSLPGSTIIEIKAWGAAGGSNPGQGGDPGSNHAGGVGGVSGDGPSFNGGPGSSLQGGNGGGGGAYYGGGGGGGLFGGGGGCNSTFPTGAGAGGGGSSFINGLAQTS